ncbi:MAG: secretion system protein, partial [Pyrobaculum sp.]
EVEVVDARELTPKLDAYVREMYGVDLKKELALRVEALLKASEVEDPAAARRAIVEMLWGERLDFKTAVEEEARHFGYV